MKRNFSYLIVMTCVGFLTGCTGQSDFSKSVNVFIGTGGHGHTFPGATVPFGMVQLSPDTRMSGWDACSGYHYSDSTIIGFSHTHLSGTGIGDYGDVLIMPTVGIQKLVRGDETVPGSGYRSGFSKKTELASPGYYSVKLDDYNVTAELTATTRAGFHRYTFPESTQSGIILDLNHTLQNHQNTLLEFKVLSDTEIQGLKVTRGWAKKHFVYFYAKFSKPLKCKIAINDSLKNFINEANGHNLKALLTFETKKDEQILVKMGISAVDYAGAKNNLEIEIPDWDFEKIRRQANIEWNKELSKIKIEGGSKDQRTIFYTALYHTKISPNIFSDCNGRYRGMDQNIHKIEGENVSADISGMIGQYAHGNEPSHHISHLYNYVGQPWKTQELIDSILQTLYLNNPDGLSGNEDCGQMSAWYVLNAMGFYSVTPGDPVYSIGRPLFNSVTITLENGKQFKIEAINNSGENKYIQSATMNGVALNTPFFNHEDIVKGGRLVLKMGSEPSTEWGVTRN